MPSYSCCATRIVRDDEKYNLRTLSCCSVEVIKGGDGYFLRCFFSQRLTFKRPCAFSRMVSRISFACSSLFISNCLSFWPSSANNLALKGVFSFSESASKVQYSCASNFSISSSRSTNKRSAGLCTRPAESPCCTLRHNSGDKLKPTRWSKARRACWASTKSPDSWRGFAIASETARCVISWNTTRYTPLFLIIPFSFNISQRCHEIASPSRSGSVAK